MKRVEKLRLERIGIGLVILLLLFLGTKEVFNYCNKVVVTGTKMGLYCFDAMIYNNDRADGFTPNPELYINSVQKRNEYYNSQDPQIRSFANMPGLFKFLVYIMALATYPGLLMLWSRIVVQTLRTLLRKRRRFLSRRKRVQKNPKSVRYNYARRLS